MGPNHLSAQEFLIGNNKIAQKTEVVKGFDHYSGFVPAADQPKRRSGAGNQIGRWGRRPML
jgi:hypothetical protein